jgi:hypothetical protein
LQRNKYNQKTWGETAQPVLPMFLKKEEAGFAPDPFQPHNQLTTNQKLLPKTVCYKKIIF